MKKWMITMAAAGIFAGSVFAADTKSETIKGVLIDTKCGAGQLKKDDPEAAAADHPKACTIKCSKGGLGVISGKTLLKLDEASAAKASEYLAKEDSTTKVVVEGVKDGETLKITSISAAK